MEEKRTETLDALEMLRIRLMHDIQVERSIKLNNDVVNYRNTTPILCNGFPIFQFRLEGSMPMYDKENKKQIAVTRDYYFKSIFNLYDFKKIDIHFDEAVLIIQHCFNDAVVRDLDNRNRKYLIDAIRHTGLIKDDSYKHLKILEEGYLVEENPFVNVLLLESKNLKGFIDHKETFIKPIRERLKNPVLRSEIERGYDEKYHQTKLDNEARYAEQSKLF